MGGVEKWTSGIQSWKIKERVANQPGSSVHGILQGRILEWVAISFSRGSHRPRDQTRVFYIYFHWQAGSLLLVPPGKPRNQVCPVAKVSPQWELVAMSRENSATATIPVGSWSSSSANCPEATLVNRTWSGKDLNVKQRTEMINWAWWESLNNVLEDIWLAKRSVSYLFSRSHSNF